MKKLMLFFGFAIFGLFTVNAQSGFKVAVNVGLPLSSTTEAASLNVGSDFAYLFEIMDNLEIGPLVGYIQFFADGNYAFTTNNGNVVVSNYRDAGFIPISSTARYYFASDKFFGGIDLGFAINVTGDANSGFFYRPKFGFVLGPVALIASYQGISGGVNYNNNNINSTIVTVSGFNSANVGVEFGF